MDADQAKRSLEIAQAAGELDPTQFDGLLLEVEAERPFRDVFSHDGGHSTEPMDHLEIFISETDPYNDDNFIEVHGPEQQKYANAIIAIPRLLAELKRTQAERDDFRQARDNWEADAKRHATNAADARAERDDYKLAAAAEAERVDELAKERDALIAHEQTQCDALIRNDALREALTALVDAVEEMCRALDITPSAAFLEILSEARGLLKSTQN